jgi:hypothetical protein
MKLVLNVKLVRLEICNEKHMAEINLSKDGVPLVTLNLSLTKEESLEMMQAFDGKSLLGAATFDFTI